MPRDKSDRHDGIVAAIISNRAEEIGELPGDNGIATAAFQLQKNEIGTLGSDLTNAPFQPFLHAGIKRPAHDDPPSIRGATLERVAMQASRRQTESLDHFLRRFANQIAEAIELFRLVSRVNSGS